jgi:hypothetical protein
MPEVPDPVPAARSRALPRASVNTQLSVPQITTQPSFESSLCLFLGPKTTDGAFISLRTREYDTGASAGITVFQGMHGARALGAR